MFSTSGQTIELLDYKDQLRFSNGGKLVFCSIRSKWVAFTPEEMVRQFLLLALLQSCSYPSSRMAVEAAIKVNLLPRRVDILVHDREFAPWLLAECKAPEVNLSQGVLDQALRYNLQVGAPFILITNGPEICCFDCRGEQPVRISQLPTF